MSLINLKITVGNSIGENSKWASFEVTDGPPPNVRLAPVIDSIDVSPSSGPKGTLFTITIVAHDPSTVPSPFSYGAWVMKDNGESESLRPTDVLGVFTWQS